MAADDSGLMRVLKACADAAPAPLFPTQMTDMDRATLDAALDRLRLAGLVEIADWVQGKGQGYVITPAGAVSLQRGRIVPAAAPEETPDPATTTWQRGEQVRAAAFEPGPPIITLTLIFLNLAVFVVGVVLAWRNQIPIDDYLARGRNPVLFEYTRIDAKDVVYRQELWRLFSYQFVHAGLLHLGLNMLGLFNLGLRLESMWGSKQFLVLYLISGVVGGCAVIMTERGAVGASGAICGLLTSLAVWLWLNRAHLPEDVLRTLSKGIVFNLLVLVWLSYGFRDRISWECHLGGALGGAAVSWPLHYAGLEGWRRQLLGWLGVVAVPVAALALALAPHWQVVSAQWRYHAALTDLETFLLAQHNEHLVPLLKVGPKQAGDEKVAAARQACADADARLGPMIEQLQAETPDDESQFAREMKQTIRYLQGWRELFQRTQQHLDDPDGWDQHRVELTRQRQEVLILSRPLRANRIMPALFPLTVQ